MIFFGVLDSFLLFLLPVGLAELAQFVELAKDAHQHEAAAMVKFRAAQKAAIEQSTLLGHVMLVPTADFWDKRLHELSKLSETYWQEKQKKGIKDTEENHLPNKELNDEFLSRGVHWSCHYNGSATSYCLIGEALANALIRVRSEAPTDIPSEP